MTSLKNAEAGPVGGPSPPPTPAARGAIATLLRSPWTYVVIAIVVFSYALLRWARTSPGFDPYGWLVWGYQTVRLNLNLGGAPSWKPVTWLFNVPYAAFGHCAVDVANHHERDDSGVDLPPGRGLVAIRRLDRLGRRVGVAKRAESFRDAHPEDAGYGNTEHSYEQHSAPVPIRE